ncbi:hypothetical protein [Geodermatophilus sp. URMC 62]|uniref:hypothetical protein n=1 Tax=Geodermatophilus sp. URMC 62 TaxID=3423414 RepID=UPI00406C3FC5
MGVIEQVLIGLCVLGVVVALALLAGRFPDVGADVRADGGPGAPDGGGGRDRPAPPSFPGPFFPGG